VLLAVFHTHLAKSAHHSSDSSWVRPKYGSFDVSPHPVEDAPTSTRVVYGSQSRPPKPDSDGLSETPTWASAIAARSPVVPVANEGETARGGAAPPWHLARCQVRRTEAGSATPHPNGSPASPATFQPPP
jgi:hypothetical protein